MAMFEDIQKANKETGHQFQEAIGTYGPEAFSWAQVDTANTISELARKEKEYILQYDCKENGYNQDAGGGFKKTVYQYSVDDGLLVGQYDSLESAANAVSGTRKSISAACLGKINNYNVKIFDNMRSEAYFYFIHSYYLKKVPENVNYCTSEYGEKFVSFIEKDNIYASQFHPEKSHKTGLTLIENFLKL